MHVIKNSDIPFSTTTHRAGSGAGLRNILVTLHHGPHAFGIGQRPGANGLRGFQAFDMAVQEQIIEPALMGLIQ